MSGLIRSVGEAVLAELRAVNRTLSDIRDRRVGGRHPERKDDR